MPASASKPTCLSVFADRARPPLSAELRVALGAADTAWRELVEQVGRVHAPIEQQWSFAGAKYGWSMRLRRGERNLLYLIPQQGQFLVGIVLGERAVAAASRLDLPQSVGAAIAAAPRYAEGTGVRLPVVSSADLGPILTLTALKMAAAK